MFGRNQSKYRNGKNFFDNFMNTAFSPQYMQMYGNLSAGQGIGEAAANASEWAYNRGTQNELLDMRRVGFDRDLRSQDINDELGIARLGQMYAPPPPQERFEDITDDQGRIIGQRSTTSNKYSPVSNNSNNRREMYKGADGYNYWVDNPTERVNPNITAAGPGVTPPQAANNQEIDDARNMISSIPVPPGSTLRDEIMRRTQQTSNTGRINPDYDPLISRAITKATNRKIGNDQDFDQFMNLLNGQQQPQPQQGQTPQPGGAEAVLQDARDAIAKGASREAVMQRLQQMGIDPSTL